jgi:hypothetical protein
MAFQAYAFQIGAFQYNTSGSVALVTSQPSGGYTHWIPDTTRKRVKETQEAVNRLPNKIQKAIKRIAKQDILQDEREAALLLEIQHVDSAFQLVYLDYLERLHADWVEREIARLLYERKVALQIRQNEEALILLLLL